MNTLPLSHPPRCACALHSRRLFTGGLLAGGALLAGPASAREGVEVGPRSSFSQLVSADDVEQAYLHICAAIAAAPGQAHLLLKKARTLTFLRRRVEAREAASRIIKDVTRASDIISRIGLLMAAVPEIVELDLNPVIASAHGCVAVDARVAASPSVLHPLRAMRQPQRPPDRPSSSAGQEGADRP